MGKQGRKEIENRKSKIQNRIILLLILGIAFWLRWQFIQTVNLYPDEFVTLLAMDMIRQKGTPILPSGLFYDHGLLYSYLAALVSFLGDAALWGRLTSLFFGLATIALTYQLGRRYFSPAVGLLAAVGLALAPAAVQWSARVRMYALLQFLVLLTIYLMLEGLFNRRPKASWAAVFSYFGALLTQFAAVTLFIPLVVAEIVTSKGEDWLPGKRHSEENIHHSQIFKFVNSSWLRWLTMGASVLVAFLVKRAGQPKGIEPIQETNPVGGVWQVLQIYGDINLNLVESWRAIAPFFTQPPVLIYSLFALGVISFALARFVILRLRSEPALPKVLKGQARRSRPSKTRVSDPLRAEDSPARAGYVIRRSRPPKTRVSDPLRAEGAAVPKKEGQTLGGTQKRGADSRRSTVIFLSVILVVTTLEMLFLVAPDRRDDKYLFMLLPVLLLLGAYGMAAVLEWANRRIPKGRAVGEYPKGTLWANGREAWRMAIMTIVVAAAIGLYSRSQLVDLFNDTGENYEAAFAHVAENWQSGDAILTGTPAAAYHYLGRNDFYAVQAGGPYDYRILTGSDDQLVERWLASPWIHTLEDLNTVLSDQPVWLVLERWGLLVQYYEPFFMQNILAQTEFVREDNGVIVLKSLPDARLLQETPAVPADAILNGVEGDFGQLKLLGYTLEGDRLTLYWQAQQAINFDYTVFVNAQNEAGETVRQIDHRPLGSVYPTTLWPVGEIIRETSQFELPPGKYHLRVGMYRLETGERLWVPSDGTMQNMVDFGEVVVGEN